MATNYDSVRLQAVRAKAVLMRDQLQAVPSVGVPSPVEASPISVPPPAIERARPTGVLNVPEDEFDVSPFRVPELSRKAAEAGVVFDKPAPTGQFHASLALENEKKTNRVRAYKNALSAHYGQKIDVRVGPQTGEIEWLDPDTKRFTLASPPTTGFNNIDLAAMGGPAIALSPEIAAGIGTAIFTKSPSLVNIAASGGAFVGEVTRLSMGQAYGVNEGIDPWTITKEAAKVAGISLVAGEGTRHLLRTATFINDVVHGRALFNRKTLKEMGDLDIADAEKIADEINALTKENKIRFDMAQASNDNDLLNAREVFKRSPQFSKEFGRADDAQFAALDEFYEVINRPYKSRLATPAQVGEAVQGIAGEGVERETVRASELVRLKTAELNVAEKSISTQPYERLGPELRRVGEQEQAAFGAWSKEAADKLNEAAGGANFIKNSHTHNVVRDIDKTVRDAIFPSVQKPQRTLIGDNIEDPETGRILNSLFDPNTHWTFSQAWDAISALKRVARVSGKGMSTDTPEVGAVKRLYTALEKDLRESAQGSSLRGQYDDFIRRYATEKQRLDEGTVAKIMQRKGGKNGRYEIADDKVFLDSLTPGSDRGAREIFDLIKNDPQAMSGMRDSLGDLYKRSVMPDGRVNMNSHKQFIQKYGKSLTVFFNKNEIIQFARPGQIELALGAREAARKSAVEKINKTFGAEIADLNNPGKVLSLIMDAKNPDKARAMMEILGDARGGKGTPDVVRAVRAQFTRDLQDRVRRGTHHGERAFSPKALDTFLNGAGGDSGFGGVVKEVMGEQYLRDLKTLDSAIKIISREARFPNRSNTAFWNDTVKGLARAYVGLFTRPGRVITAADRIRGRAAERLIASSLLNPDNLRALMSLRGVHMKSQKTAIILGNMGASVLQADFE